MKVGIITPPKNKEESGEMNTYCEISITKMEKTEKVFMILNKEFYNLSTIVKLYLTIPSSLAIENLYFSWIIF
jgi:hypothetical protein